MKQKIIFILLPVLLLCLTGFSIRTVKISGGKLIDLDAFLTASDIGQPGSEQKEEQTASSEETAASPERESGSGAETRSETVSLTITVRGTLVYLNGMYYPHYSYDRESGELEGEEEILKQIRKAGTVTLEDYYAEAHAYRHVLKLVRSLKDLNRITETGREE